MRIVTLCVAILLGVLTVAGCARRASLETAFKRLDHRDEWTRHPKLNLPRHPAEKHLGGWVIVLDPGHGGDAHRPNFKRGPTGVREAEINWRVAKMLEKLLLDAGAQVLLTREDDVDVSLEDRARIANEAKADLFISIHHNAASNPEANYTTVWFHGRVDDVEPALDVARYVAHHVGDALRTTVAKTSPLMSDEQMYETGFAVLRHAEVPAILSEASFHSNPQEEQRLRDANYNLREAYAIYQALCEYAYGGRPTQTEPTVRIVGDTVLVETTLNDGLPKNWWGGDRQRIIASTIRVTLNGKVMRHRFDPSTHRLTAELPVATTGPPQEIQIHHANMLKHHNWPQRYELSNTHP